MSESHRSTQERASIPAMGPSLPTATVHIVFLVVAATLCVIVLQNPFWIAIGLLLAVAGTFLPTLVPKPWLLLVLGVGQLWREPSVADITFYLLLAGLHLLQVLSSLAGQVPWRGRIQPVAFLRPLRQYVLIQAVVQGVAVGALSMFSNGTGTVPALSIVTAAMLGVAAFALARGLRRARTADSF